MEELKKITTSQNRIDLLHASSIDTLEDIIYHYPYKYDEVTEIWPPVEDKCCVEGVIISSPKVFYKGRFSRMTFNVSIKGNDYIVTIFNRHFLRPHLTPNRIITLQGKVEGNRFTASNILLKNLDQLSGITPVYSLKDGLTSHAFSQYVKKVLGMNIPIEDSLPIEIRETVDLMSKKEALYAVHFPMNHEQLQKAIKTLKYEEFLNFELALSYRKMQREQEVGYAKDFSLDEVNAFIHTLPFKLTKDQKQSAKDILLDLHNPTIMYRFLQGDVGSGKTIVAAIGLYANYLSGYQGALMAPTEVLATQHYSKLKKTFEAYDMTIALLTGSLTLKEKKEIYEGLESGAIDLVIGTHALFQESVHYKKLGFVVTDEQHRFGVKQRKALKQKGEGVDFLVMSATPIPRTLAMSLYGDMDVSSIETRPEGRKPILTKYFEGSSMKPFLKQLKDYLAQGGQCYVICPLIEDNEDLPLKSALTIYEAMSSYFKGHYQTGLLHGSLKDEEKNAVMQDFKDNKIQILVSTTVVEVGVDVPNANMMVIYNAERFGLSSIHQLRGRIGRGNQQGYCFLLSEAQDEPAKERLHYLEEHDDGFEISQYDLKTRGPGELLGDKQSGLPAFMMGDIFKDMNILEETRRYAIKMIHDYYKYGEYENYIEMIPELQAETGNKKIN